MDIAYDWWYMGFCVMEGFMELDLEPLLFWSMMGALAWGCWAYLLS